MTGDDDQFNLDLGKEAREDGMMSVNRPRWCDVAFGMLPEVKADLANPFTVEDIRRALLQRGLERPHHPNQWGAFGMSMSRKKVIEQTGEFVWAKDKKSHACRVPQYRWCEGERE